MMFLEKQRGSVLCETIFLIWLLVFGVFWGHVEIVKLWRKKIGQLQLERIAYDGVKRW